MLHISYWVLPIISGVFWLATLLTMLVYWVVATSRTHYESMAANQDIAYISDVGASNLKPLFIAGCCITTVTLNMSFGADRWLRHKGRLVPNTTVGEKVLSGLTIVFAVVGTAGLILLSVFDTLRHKMLHDVFLLLFIAGYVLSAIFICWEYQRLGIRNRSHRVLRVSFWIKLVFVLLSVALAIVFVACTFTGNYNTGASLEWAIGFIFSLYVFSFYVDLYPAVYTKNGRRRYATKGMAPAMRDMEEGSELGHPHHYHQQDHAAAAAALGSSSSDQFGGSSNGVARAQAMEHRRPLDDE